MSPGTVAAIVIVAMLLSAVVTGMAVYAYLSGRCKRDGSSNNGSGLLSGEDTSTGSRFSRMSD